MSAFDGQRAVSKRKRMREAAAVDPATSIVYLTEDALRIDMTISHISHTQPHA